MILETDYIFDMLGRVTDIIQQGNSGNAVANKHLTLAYNKLSKYTASIATRARVPVIKSAID